jgi:hypothetical protein
MNYFVLIFSVFFISAIILILYETYKTGKKVQLIAYTKRPENILVELRAYKDTYGITDTDFTDDLPYHLEYKTKADKYWKPIRMFQDLIPGTNKYSISKIVIKDKEDLENWKQKFKTLQDVNDFKTTQEELMKLWEEKETDKNCIY